jgi:hypothetical protein
MPNDASDVPIGELVNRARRITELLMHPPLGGNKYHWRAMVLSWLRNISDGAVCPRCDLKLTRLSDINECGAPLHPDCLVTRFD